MEIIIVYGASSRNTAERLRRSILQNCKTCAVTVTSAPDQMQPAEEGAVFLFQNDAALPERGCLPCPGAVAFDGESRRIAAFLQAAGCPAVDFGTSPRATVSLSSMTEGSATVSVQRHLFLPDGRVVDPCEIPVFLSHPMSPRQVLAGVTVLLLAAIPVGEGYWF